MPPYSCIESDGSWNQVPPSSIIYVEPSEEGDDSDDEESHFYPMINGIGISGERIDLMPPTKILLMRKDLKELRHKLAK